MASTSSALPPVATTLPSASDPHAPSQTITHDGFLKPTSPRKRRRSLDRSEPSARTLEGQVRDKLTVSPISPALTGANEMAEQKRRKLEHLAEAQSTSKLQSPNPRAQALSVLRGAGPKMTKATDAARSLANSVPAIATSNVNASPSAQVSPASNSSFNTSSGNAGVPQVASPIQMGDSDVPGEDEAHAGGNDDTQASSDRPYTYPDPRLSAAQLNNSNRNHSVSGAGGEDTRSPAGSNKKHKCPYCDTEFTRHHNLKSHLLTHSQEKPYLCQQCDMRFRRLHDLKRHTKLHTGERPHVCSICNRKFARGDALARHTKGAGGCAGHRASVGSFSNDAGGEGEMVMDGLMYAGAESQEPGEMDENDGPRRQLRQTQSYGNLQRQGTGLPQTYPPAPGRSGPHLQPPQTYSGNVSPAPQHAPYPHPSQQGSYPPPFQRGNMTESPGPISPSAGPQDPRRSSINSTLHRYAQQGASHAHGSPQAPTATMHGLPPPNTVPSNAPPNSHFSHLPPLPSIATSDRAGPAPHGHAHNASGSYASAPGSASTHNSLSSHGQGSGERGALGIDERDRLYAIIDSMRRNLEACTDKVTALTNEVETLKKKVDGNASIHAALNAPTAS